MKRGDLVTIALQGDHGKSRPAVIVQADCYVASSTVALLPVTSTLIEANLVRVEVEPSAGNGLLKRSQIMVDRPQTAPRGKIGPVVGHLEEATMLAVNRKLAVFLGLA